MDLLLNCERLYVVSSSICNLFRVFYGINNNFRCAEKRSFRDDIKRIDMDGKREKISKNKISKLFFGLAVRNACFIFLKKMR